MIFCLNFDYRSVGGLLSLTSTGFLFISEYEEGNSAEIRQATITINADKFSYV